MAGPLEGVTVLDFGRALAAPLCTMILADLGAEVVKFEPPKGDDSRAWPPYQGDQSSYFMSVNRNKRSAVLDLRRGSAQEVVREMAASADVVIENYRPGVMAGWGIDYESLSALNPRLIYCSISGFGKTGPMAGERATDVFMQAFSGLMSVTGEPGRSPVRVGASVCDITCGLYAAIGVLAAIQARNTTGRGQLIDTSLFETQAAVLAQVITGYWASGVVPGPLGSGHPSIAPYQAFQASDGYVSLAAFNDRLWGKAMHAMGLTELIDDPRFITNRERSARRAELESLLSPVFATRTVAEWEEIMSAADVPLAPVNSIDKVAGHPQFDARDMRQVVQHPSAGEVALVGFPLKLSDTPCEVRMPPPRLGEHTVRILRDMGISADRITELLADGAAVEARDQANDDSFA